MHSNEVLRIVDWVESHDACYQINGGWAVDALVGRQTRPHRDLDLFIDADVVPSLLSWLRSRGYAVETDELPARVELRDGRLRVDVHPMTLDAAGNGTQWDDHGTAIYSHPAAARTTGSIDGHQVCVASAARLRELHEGYPPRDVDHHDLALLNDL
ncbi:MAG TPA: lincomycin resistance protein LmrB [Microlunatus sp.]